MNICSQKIISLVFHTYVSITLFKYQIDERQYPNEFSHCSHASWCCEYQIYHLAEFAFSPGVNYEAAFHNTENFCSLFA